MDKKLTILTDKEVGTIKKILNTFEYQTVNQTGVRRISGGFAIADMTHYDEDLIYIRLKWGIQSDCENTVHTEQWKLNRDTLNLAKSVEEKVKAITD